MRLIDADRAIDYIDRAITAWSEDKEIAIDCLRNLPSVQPEQKWIPVTERLPEIGVDVLVTEDTGGMKEVWIDSCWVDDDTGRTLWYVSLNVTAWMPLPEPYKGEKDE